MSLRALCDRKNHIERTYVIIFLRFFPPLRLPYSPILALNYHYHGHGHSLST